MSHYCDAKKFGVAELFFNPKYHLLFPELLNLPIKVEQKQLCFRYEFYGYWVFSVRT